MTYLPIPETRPQGREAQVAYLRDHFRYHTMNSWNLSTSYAHRIKIAALSGLSREDRDRCYQGLSCDESLDDFSRVLRQFEADNPGWAMGTNGRSGGYLVLYQRDGDRVYVGRAIDADEDFESWDDEDVDARVDEVWAFDRACEQAVAAYVDFCRRHVFEETEVMVPKKVIVARE
jgi:hypothetical protein